MWPASRPTRSTTSSVRTLIDNQEPVLQRHLADGRIIAVRAQPMANGGWVATFEDITAQERAALALREQHRRFDAALNNMAHGLCMLDEELNLIVCNTRYLDMYGMSPDVVRPGVTMRTIVEHSIALGNYTEATPDEFLQSYFERLGTASSCRTGSSPTAASSRCSTIPCPTAAGWPSTRT
jgi:PAS domain-containing protein